MTYLPKSELVGVLAPSSINTRDIGKNWTDIGAITSFSAVTQQFPIYLGNGIVIAGNGLGRIFRSTDYGNLWNDTGAISGGNFLSGAYLGNGIVVVGDDARHIWRNTNFGNNGISGSPTGEWVDEGPITAAGADISSISYLGNGIVIFSTSTGRIFRSTNYGMVPWTDLGDITGAGLYIDNTKYLENGIVLAGDTVGNIYRSTNFGAAWAGVAGNPISSNDILSFSYAGNGLVLANAVKIAAQGTIFRSINFGATWIDLGLVHDFNTLIYLGDGVFVSGDPSGHIFRSDNFGMTWSDLGAIPGASSFVQGCYLSNGISIMADDTGEFFRSDVSYKTDESQVNYPRIISGDLAPGGAGLRLIDTVAPGTNIYTNLDKTRTLIVSVGCTCNTPAAGNGAAFDIQADSAATPVTLVSPTVGIATGLLGESDIFMTTGYVGPGLNYRVNQLIGGAGVVTLDKWFEMYI